MNRKVISQGVVAKRIRKESFACLKHVIALEGYHDDGKTSVLKTLIAELHRRDPKSWRGGRRFNPSMVRVTCERDYSAVFCYKGVIVAIKTGGDTPSVIARNFEYFSMHHAVIGITAVKVNGENESFLAATAYAQAETIIGFRSKTLSIRGETLREECREMKVVKKIIAALDVLVCEVKANKEA